LFREKPDSKLATKDTNAEQIVTDIQQQNTTSSQTATPGVEPIDSSKSLNQPLEGASTSTTGKDEGATGKKEKTVEASTTKTGQPSSATSVNIPYKKGEAYKIYQFPFGSGVYTQPDPELDKLVDVLKKNSSVKIAISAYTDQVGSAEYNRNLSERRAKAIFDYIASRGIDVKRMSFQGKGISTKYPTDEENRRAEFILTE